MAPDFVGRFWIPIFDSGRMNMEVWDPQGRYDAYEEPAARCLLRSGPDVTPM
jgi:hypothetical protein